MLKLKNMKLAQKFTILGIVLLLVAALPTTFYVMNVTAELDVAKHEVAGTAPIIALQGVIQFVQQHRSVAAGMLGGNESWAILLPAIQARLNKASEVVNVSLKEAGISSQIASHWDAHKQHLIAIGQAVASRSLKSAESTAQHTRLIAELLLVAEKIQDESGLSLDPLPGTYFLMNATMVNAPKLAENMEQLRAMGIGFLVAGNLPAEGRVKLVSLYNNVSMHFLELTRNLEKATSADAEMKAALEKKGREMKAQIDRTLAITNQNLINVQELKLPANEFFEEYTRTINSLYEFNAITANNLVGALNTRVTDLQQSLYWMFGLILCALIGTILIVVVFIRSIVVPMREAVEVTNAIASGNFTSNIDVESTNETGQLFQALKKMTGSLQDERNQVADLKAEQSSVSKARMMVMFKLDGTIVSANERFLNAVGYTLEEVQGKHHSMFVDPNDKQDPEYQSLWDRLSNCEFFMGHYKRIGKGGKEVWIQSNYNPVMDANGKSYRVVLYGTDITAMKLYNADSDGQLQAVNKAYAVAEFNMDGTIITANNNFLNMLGYTLEEIKDKSHDMFVDPICRQSPECMMFWDKLVRGEYDTDQYKRIGMGGKEVWIQASYNPILDMNNNPFKVVVYAIDITEQINASQVLDKVIEKTLAVVSVANDGDLTERIPIKCKMGAIETLCAGINDLMENYSTSLDEVVHVLSALTQGNLTEKITAEYSGVFGQIKDDTNTTVDKLTEIVGNIRAGIVSINTASKHIAACNDDLSQRTEGKALSLEEIASSMKELTSTVKQIAENAKQAKLFTIGASDIAMKSISVVGQVVITMSDINDSSKRIVDIISVIDGIAFQTNILALNAAVEAARAGEQGRGFAVIATEVRTLAQRSAAAAKEIKKLIDDSVRKVDVGIELIDQAGKGMDEIVMSVKRVTDIMAEISAASQEQSSGIEHVNQAVSQIDEVTQLNAAFEEEAAAASESMIEQSEILMRTVSVFQLKHGAAHMSNASSPAEERRGSNRAVNVARLPNVAVQSKPLTKKPVAPKPAKSGTDDE